MTQLAASSPRQARLRLIMPIVRRRSRRAHASRPCYFSRPHCTRTLAFLSLLSASSTQYRFFSLHFQICRLPLWLKQLLPKTLPTKASRLSPPSVQPMSSAAAAPPPSAAGAAPMADQFAANESQTDALFSTPGATLPAPHPAPAPTRRAAQKQLVMQSPSRAAAVARASTSPRTSPSKSTAVAGASASPRTSPSKTSGAARRLARGVTKAAPVAPLARQPKTIGCRAPAVGPEAGHQ